MDKASQKWNISTIFCDVQNMDLYTCQRIGNFVCIFCLLWWYTIYIYRYTSLSGRWKVDAKGVKMQHPVSKLPILQFVSIKRKDCGEWAIPGVGGFYFSNIINIVSPFALNILCNLPSSIFFFIVTFSATFSLPSCFLLCDHVDSQSFKNAQWQQIHSQSIRGEVSLVMNYATMSLFTIGCTCFMF